MFGRKKTPEAQPVAQPQAVEPAAVAPSVEVPQPAAMAPAAQQPAAGAPAPGAQPGAAQAQPPLSPEEAQRRSAIMVRQSLAFAQIVTILLRSPSHRHFAIADLEWLVVPPLTLGQFVIAEAKAQADGPGFPVAMALWATVSPETDQRLSENLTSPIRLRPDEWKSGDIMWLIDAVGEPRVLTGLVQQLAENAFKGRPIKLRQVGEGGKTIVAVLGGQAPAAA